MSKAKLCDDGLLLSFWGLRTLDYPNPNKMFMRGKHHQKTSTLT